MASGGENEEREEHVSLFVLASDLTIDPRPFLEKSQREAEEEEERDIWHECPSSLAPEDFSDLDMLQVFTLQGTDKHGNRIVRIVGKLFPAPVISGERLKRYILYKISSELQESPFCIVYIHSCVQKEDNSPGISILRWIYEDLPSDFKERLQIVYFLHPGLRSRLFVATFGRFLSGGLYSKIQYVSRLEYLWDEIKKGQVEIPEFVQSHDNDLEHRPLMDYGIEPDLLRLQEMPSSYSYMRQEERWASRAYS
ncbi:hypothetical protein AMTRI_Chr01g109290 [Amborella trichopoda]|uniref:CRAL-TRIO domain-containing protein n=1 Tax=Amborella trichopoda TaxID=13333 RepID=W1PD93_AMBTC|nr:ganglioside-induced differentiation-associated-protein 2 [Amborella trichopoda]ERN05030.1 hypothetical protein AMTR_s00053p00051430 [Amborella trichopoda]|eukprot:XP_006843355.1 ganglioside-induced differentiation-associated-protein 2 [Amborella trichopoda]